MYGSPVDEATNRTWPARRATMASRAVSSRRILSLDTRRAARMSDDDRAIPGAPPDGTSRTIPRRAFVASIGAAAALPATLSSVAQAGTATERKIALQLYTVRDAIAKDLEGTLKRVADLGFRHVETAFWPQGISHEQAAGFLADAGLTAVASHIEITGDYRRNLVAISKAYRCPNMIWHGWPEDARYGTVEGTRELIRTYNEVAAFCRDNGMAFGLHNHWWEYMRGPGGKLVFEHWLEGLAPSVFLEVDTYWVKVAGNDPAAIIRRLGKRVRFLHIKDGPAKWHENLAADNPDPMSAVGKGAQDMPSILAAARATDPWLVVEMDKVAGDVFEALAESLAYLKAH